MYERIRDRVINAHFANMAKLGTYAEKVKKKKGLKTTKLPEVDLPNDVDSLAIFQIPPLPLKLTTELSTGFQTSKPRTSETIEGEFYVRPNTRHPSISTANTTSVQSHVQALEVAILTMDADKANLELEELEINTVVPTDICK